MLAQRYLTKKPVAGIHEIDKHEKDNLHIDFIFRMLLCLWTGS